VLRCFEGMIGFVTISKKTYLKIYVRCCYNMGTCRQRLFCFNFYKKFNTEKIEKVFIEGEGLIKKSKLL